MTQLWDLIQIWTFHYLKTNLQRSHNHNPICVNVQGFSKSLSTELILHILSFIISSSLNKSSYNISGSLLTDRGAEGLSSAWNERWSPSAR